ncbi:NAD-dependent epimerase/dehydratase family protein [Ectobacillus antri]|uniref:NAD-dependent epimerase/dehydratase family protein n=1 Tax=Ectobacillus antri TaxID=2486280 RepID=A0ABT6H5R6_9BACI|nr:NAD-dependent epimerase/dehydratase family protein [Ectobacillus antri]MDG4656627.1 NAD-dependent epimerase/dehydratase family protein [Ectobacillus antri]MDG5754010.1 NAD-dependent epimerase/dehydratase family protein [Ectobacillus antri]
MSVVLVTGAAGLIGSEAVEFFIMQGFDVVGIDNNMRQMFFGDEGTTVWNSERLKKVYQQKYTHLDADIRDKGQINQIFSKYKENIVLIIHTAAQPSHDWAVRDPYTDFSVNANGTLNLLEAMRVYCPEAVFIFTSTNKVYGDRPNTLPFVEMENRWEISPTHVYVDGIREDMSVDQCLHSLFGSSKLAADILVQEYGRYFNFKTFSLRCGVLSGSRQSGVQLHGFTNYLIKCNVLSIPYTILGYKGKQVRDVIHSSDVIRAFYCIFQNPRRGGEVYNLGGGRHSNISILEAIALSECITGQKFCFQYSDKARVGDHIWYISNLERFQNHYPNWKLQYTIEDIFEEIFSSNKKRWKSM